MRILVAEKIAREGLALLQARHDVDVRLGLTPEQLLEAVEPYDALIVRSQVQVTEPVIAAGTHLRVVARAGVGLDNIDVAAARGAGLVVLNAPDGNTIAAAEHTLGLLLAVARHIPAADASMRAGEWARSKLGGTELRGKTLGIIGLGRIGMAVADRARAFGMRIVGSDPNSTAANAVLRGVQLLSLAEVLATADVVTVHVPLTAETHHMLDEASIRTLKPGAIVLNLARGGVVDETALADALREGRLGGAGIDVFESEPPKPGSPLLAAPNVVLTPHIAASTAEAQVAVGIEIAERVITALDALPVDAIPAR
jgi:D-3-phosphoglycerate dehydrogenase / 2-oxoglutarate reductase